MAEETISESRRSSARSRRVRFGENDEDDQVVVYVHEIPSRYSPFDDLSNWSVGTAQKKEKLNDSAYSDSDSDREVNSSSSPISASPTLIQPLPASTSSLRSPSPSPPSSAESSPINPALAAVVVSSAPLSSFAPRQTPVYSSYAASSSVNEESNVTSKSRYDNSDENKSKPPKSRRKSERRRSRQESRRDSLSSSDSISSMPTLSNTASNNSNHSSSSSNESFHTHNSGGKLLLERPEMHETGSISPQSTFSDSTAKTTTYTTVTQSVSPTLRDIGATISVTQPLATVTFTPISQTMVNSKSLPKLKMRPTSARNHVVSGISSTASATTQKSANGMFGASNSSIVSSQTANDSVIDGRVSPQSFGTLSIVSQSHKSNLSEAAPKRAQSAPSRWYSDSFDRNGNYNNSSNGMFGGYKASLSGFSRDNGASSWQRSFSWIVANNYSTVSTPTVQVQQLFDDFYK